MGQHRLDGVFGAGEVHRQRPVPGGVVGILKQAVGRDAGVVHQQGDGPQPRPGVPDHGFHGPSVRHIRLDGQGVTAFRLDERRHGQGVVPPFQIIHADVPAPPGKLQGHSPADAPGGAGDQCGLFHFASLLSFGGSITKKTKKCKKGVDKTDPVVYSMFVPLRTISSAG